MKGRIWIWNILALICLTACDRWFDVNPQTEVKQKELFSTDQGFYNALMGVYLNLSDPELYGGELQFGLVDVLAQTYSISNTTGGGSAYLYAVSYDWNNCKTLFEPLWEKAYTQIANCNNILKHLEGNRGLFPEGNYEIVEAEARALRAMLQLDLLRLFGPSPAGGMSKPAIPYVDAVVTVPFPQLTVEKTLERIIGDLERAFDLLKVNDPYFTGIPDGEFDFMTANGFRQNREYRLNYYGVSALLARAYLYKGDKSKALEYATKVIGADYHFTTQEEMNAMGVTLCYSEIISGIYLKNTLLKKQTEKWFSENAGSTKLKISSAGVETLFEVASLGSTDLRKKNQFGSRENENEVFLNKYFTGSLLPLIRLSEVYYIAAECAEEPETRFGYLNEVRRHRFIPILDSRDPQIDLENEIYKEYAKDFLGEGQLFFYMKRKGMTSFTGVNGVEIRETGDPVYQVPVPDMEKEFGNII